MRQWEVTAHNPDGGNLDTEPARDYADAWRIALVMFEDAANATVTIHDHVGQVNYRIKPEDMPEPRKPRVPVHVGDRVRDPMDGEWREVIAVTGLAVRFRDGGTMGIREAQEADKLSGIGGCCEDYNNEDRACHVGGLAGDVLPRSVRWHPSHSERATVRRGACRGEAPREAPRRIGLGKAKLRLPGRAPESC